MGVKRKYKRSKKKHDGERRDQISGKKLRRIEKKRGR